MYQMPNRPKGALFLFILVLLTAPLIASCSANRFKEPVQDFGKAVSITDKLFRQYAKAAHTASLDDTVLEHSGSGRALVYQPGSCVRGSSSAECFVQIEGGEPLIVESPSENVMLQIDAIVSYSKALSRVVEANTASELDESLGKLERAVTGLADTVRFDSAPWISPLTTVVKFIGGQYVEHKRLQILRRGVAAAREPIGELAAQMKEQVAAYYDVVLNSSESTILGAVRAQPTVAAMTGAVARRTNLVLIRTAVDSTAAGRAALDAPPMAAFDALANAHEKLASAIENPELDLGALFGEIRGFAKKANDAYEAIQTIVKER